VFPSADWSKACCSRAPKTVNRKRSWPPRHPAGRPRPVKAILARLAGDLCRGRLAIQLIGGSTEGGIRTASRLGTPRRCASSVRCPRRLSRARHLGGLSDIAYHQPVTRPRIEEIPGGAPQTRLALTSAGGELDPSGGPQADSRPARALSVVTTEEFSTPFGPGNMSGPHGIEGDQGGAGFARSTGRLHDVACAEDEKARGTSPTRRSKKRNDGFVAKPEARAAAAGRTTMPTTSRKTTRTTTTVGATTAAGNFPHAAGVDEEPDSEPRARPPVVAPVVGHEALCRAL